MQSYNQSNSFPRWGELLHKAVTEPGVISQAFRRFHNYSLGNQLLALQQCQLRKIEPGPIATFPRWKELGRYVRKGEKAITLCMPITVKAGKAIETPEKSEAVADGEQAAIFTRFVYKAHWFVLAQTDGAEYKPEPVPGWDEERALTALDIRRVTFGMPDGNLQGYAMKREVAINPLADQPHSTLFHELGHIVLGHTSEGAVNSDSVDRTPRNIRELEAECVALLCCESLSLPGSAESRGYIQSWFKGHEVPERSAQRIFHAADTILKAGRTERPFAGEATPCA
jgi:antirestriction protein ArdC